MIESESTANVLHGIETGVNQVNVTRRWKRTIAMKSPTLLIFSHVYPSRALANSTSRLRAVGGGDEFWHLLSQAYPGFLVPNVRESVR